MDGLIQLRWPNALTAVSAKPRTQVLENQGILNALDFLEEVPLVEPRTVVLQDKIWGGFSRWLSDLLSPGAVRAAMAHPFLLVQFAKDIWQPSVFERKILVCISALACLSTTKLRDHQALYGNLLGDGNSLGTG